MRLCRVDPGPDLAAWAGDEAGLGARAQHDVADLEVNDIMGAERLDDARRDLDIALLRIVGQQHAFRANAELELALLATGFLELAREGRREHKADTAETNAD